MVSPNLLKSKIPFMMVGGGVKVPTFDSESKYERIFYFIPCVYLTYFRSYGHLKIVKCIGMYHLLA